MPIEISSYTPKQVMLEQQAIRQSYFGEMPPPSDSLFEVMEIIRTENLFRGKPFFIPSGPMSLDGHFGVDPDLLETDRATLIPEHFKALQRVGGWVIFDITPRPAYDSGRQMYDDTPRFKEILGALRSSPTGEFSENKDVPNGSRFDQNQHSIDGLTLPGLIRHWNGDLASVMAGILGVPIESVTTPPYANFYYVATAHPELTESTTREWFSNPTSESGVERFCGGALKDGNLTCERGNGNSRDDFTGFRLQISFPAKIA